MVITQQPSALNLCGNLPDVRITSAEPVETVLSFNGAQILQETYQPSAGNEIIIKLKGLIDDLLSLEVPGFDVAVYNQASAYADINLNFNGGAQQIDFRVVKGGVDSLLLDASEFLPGNFLTWQPQQKFVKYTDPEWLTYYASVESLIKVKAYYQATTETITLATLPAEQLSTVNANYGQITSLLANQPLYFDVWIEVVGEVKSFVQRYILTTEIFEADDVFVFANSLGGLDTIRFTGEKEENNDYKFDSALFDEDTLDFDVEINQVFSKNSGYFRSERNRVWSLEFFKSLQKYYNRSGAISRVVVTKPKLESVGDELAGYAFDFALSRQTKYLNLSRADELPTDLQIIGPNDELFFLAPRLSEFPQANFNDVLFAVQSPYEDKWYKFSLANILASFQEQDPTVPSYVKTITPEDIAAWNAGGGIVGEVYTKQNINDFFSGGIGINGYNKTNWDNAYSWGNHASAGYLVGVSNDFIKNQPALQPNAKLNVAEGTFNDTLKIPGTNTPWSISIDENATGGTANPLPAPYLSDLQGLDLASRADGYVIYWDATTLTYKFKTAGTNYTLPTATASVLGGVKIGTGLTIAGDGTLSVTALGGVTSFNTRTGAITLNSGDVTGALGYTPYNASNPSGFITASALVGYATQSWVTANFAGINGYNKTNWDNAYSWGNHASAGYATQSYSIASFQPLENQRLSTTNNVVFAEIKALTKLEIPGTTNTWQIYVDENATGGTANPLPAPYLSDLQDISLTSRQDGYVIYWDATTLTYKFKEGGSASTVPWTGVTGRPTALSQFTNDLGNYGNWITKMQGDTYYPSVTGYNKTNWDTAYGWGNHASVGYALANGSNATGIWGINISGNATRWGNQIYQSGGSASDFTDLITYSPTNGYWSNTSKSALSTALGLDGLNNGSTLINNISGKLLGTTGNQNWNVPNDDGLKMIMVVDGTLNHNNPTHYASALSVMTEYTGFQLAVSGDPSITNGLYYRRQDGAGTYSSWKTLAFNDGSNTTGNWGIDISGNASSATYWGGALANFGAQTGSLSTLIGFSSTGGATYWLDSQVKSWLGVGATNSPTFGSLNLSNTGGGAAAVNFYGTQSNVKNYSFVNAITGISNTGFSLRNITDSTNPFCIDGSDNAIFSNNVNASSFYANNWFRSTGASGWFNQDYGGGIYMEDTSWVRVYNGKGFLVGGTVGIQSPRFMNTTDGFKSYNYRGLVGDYDQNSSSEKIIWTIGDNWNTLATMYGLGYTYNSIAGFGHSLFMALNGTKTIQFSLETGSANFAGTVTAPNIKATNKLEIKVTDGGTPTGNYMELSIELNP